MFSEYKLHSITRYSSCSLFYIFQYTIYYVRCTVYIVVWREYANENWSDAHREQFLIQTLLVSLRTFTAIESICHVILCCVVCVHIWTYLNCASGIRCRCLLLMALTTCKFKSDEHVKTNKLTSRTSTTEWIVNECITLFCCFPWSLIVLHVQFNFQC